jgi:hypothetical protein
MLRATNDGCGSVACEVCHSSMWVLHVHVRCPLRKGGGHSANRFDVRRVKPETLRAVLLTDVGFEYLPGAHMTTNGIGGMQVSSAGAISAGAVECGAGRLNAW